MGTKGPQRRIVRRTKFESLEDRQMFSAEPLGGGISHHAEAAPDFWHDRSVERDLDALMGDVEQTLASAHALSGVTQARNDYGFLGAGQTVAVIDSGIAWDHPNLGNGFGANARVVGGWDFTWENDANPYDDGPAGSHGTHVAGIIGATENSTGDLGVAPGVDLVGLRVFDDEGDGYFSWVEKALRWVHTNRNSFANPITAVNLSLGTAYNSAKIPGWAMLEEEFAQLEADGIFVAVSAGNSFSTYKTAGLSYPAASPHVVPVMSVDATGSLSTFSQRHARAIAAPGRMIRSTVPDYVGNQNGKTDDWANYSGTSMASPYVAGASVLVREAMQFVGMTGITQDLIYDHMLATADQIFDTATNQYFKRLNLSAALDALVPDDEFGSTAAAAQNLGSIGGEQSISGLIGKIDDQDYFTFTAGATGTMSVTAEGTHRLVPQINLAGTAGSFADGTLSFEVVAGQSYTISLQTAAGHGIGYYDLDFSIEESAVEPVFAVKSVTAADGAVYTLDSEDWLSVNGRRIWSQTRDFTLGSDGTLYWHCTNGVIQHRQATGVWKTIAYNATKFAVSNAGDVYSLSADGWLRVNGNRAWNQTADFDLVGGETLFWHCTNGCLQLRLASGVWQNVATDVSRFAVRDDGTIYILDTNEWLKVRGTKVWNRTHDFLLTPDQCLYWHCDNGVLQRYSNGCWETLGKELTKFAVRQDGSVYSLSTNGDLYVDGARKWSNVKDIGVNAEGRLVVESIDGSTRPIAGHFSVSRALVSAAAAIGSQSIVSANGVDQAGTQPLASQSFMMTTQGKLQPFTLDSFLEIAASCDQAATEFRGMERDVAESVCVTYAEQSSQLDRALQTIDENEAFGPVERRDEDGLFNDVRAALATDLDQLASDNSLDALFEELGR